MTEPMERMHMIATLEYFRMHAQRNDDGTYTIDGSMMDRVTAAIERDTPSLLDLSASMMSTISVHSFADCRNMILAVIGMKQAPAMIAGLRRRE